MTFMELTETLNRVGVALASAVETLTKQEDSLASTITKLNALTSVATKQEELLENLQKNAQVVSLMEYARISYSARTHAATVKNLRLEVAKLMAAINSTKKAVDKLKKDEKALQTEQARWGKTLEFRMKK